MTNPTAYCRLTDDSADLRMGKIIGVTLDDQNVGMLMVQVGPDDVDTTEFPRLLENGDILRPMNTAIYGSTNVVEIVSVNYAWRPDVPTILAQQGRGSGEETAARLDAAAKNLTAGKQGDPKTLGKVIKDGK